MEVMLLNKGNFDEEVLNSDKQVLVDFFATWCGPCRMVSPMVDEIAKENSDIKVCKVNVDDEQELAGLYNVMSIPTLVAFKEGKETGRIVGAKPKNQILELVK